jgi:alkylation response protein AidB-like acyl-CoA dehydrogenase
MHALTVDYLKTRKQFGTTIGSFQALQHRAVDMFVAIEQARSLALLATMSVGGDPAGGGTADVGGGTADANAQELHNNIAAAKVQIGRSARFVGQQAIQLHGGIGMTMEAKVGHYFKRVTMIDTMFGDADYHLGRLAEEHA